MEWGSAITTSTDIPRPLQTHFAMTPTAFITTTGPGLDDVTRTSGVGVERATCAGRRIVDLDNDGHPRLVHVTGWLSGGGTEAPQYANKTPRAVFRNLGNGTFEELMETAGPAIGEAHCSGDAPSVILTMTATWTCSSST